MFTNKANCYISLIMTFFYSSMLPLGLPLPVSIANCPTSYANGSIQVRDKLTEVLRTETEVSRWFWPGSWLSVFSFLLCRLFSISKLNLIFCASWRNAFSSATPQFSSCYFYGTMTTCNWLLLLQSQRPLTTRVNFLNEVLIILLPTQHTIVPR